ncbi:hypothetical protein ACFU96_44225 [Streptomyces sp. NPDC057620]|uniref:hypothetical protein n=1 Tax=Streptomyces sp. NPDC057620 TaxID=3346185 RepID=UPI0036A4AD11
MSVSSSVYAVYGVVIAPPRDIGAVTTALEDQSAADGTAEFARIELFTVGDSEHIILGAACEELGPNTYRPADTFAVSPAWSEALLGLAGDLGLHIRCGPAWLLVHDLS